MTVLWTHLATEFMLLSRTCIFGMLYLSWLLKIPADLRNEVVRKQFYLNLQLKLGVDIECLCLPSTIRKGNNTDSPTSIWGANLLWLRVCQRPRFDYHQRRSPKGIIILGVVGWSVGLGSKAVGFSDLNICCDVFPEQDSWVLFPIGMGFYKQALERSARWQRSDEHINISRSCSIRAL